MIGAIEAYVTDIAVKEVEAASINTPPTRKKVAVIGAGPADN